MCSSLRDRERVRRTRARCAARAEPEGTHPLYLDWGVAPEPRADIASLRAAQVHVGRELEAHAGTRPGRRRTASPWQRSEAMRQPEAMAPKIPETSHRRAQRPSLPGAGNL